MISRNKQPRLLARVEQYIGHLTSVKADYKARPSFSVPCDPATPTASNYASLLFTRTENSIGMGMAKRSNAYLEQRRILINDVIRRSAFSAYCVSWLFKPRTGNSRRELSEGAVVRSTETSTSKKSRNPFRCHRIDISGLTTVRTERQSKSLDSWAGVKRTESVARRGFFCLST